MGISCEAVPSSKWGTQQSRWVHGWTVYVVQEGDDGPLKIGSACHPLRRLSGLQAGNCRKLRLVEIYNFGEQAAARRAETALHIAFGNRRIDREWFDLTVAEIRAGIDEALRWAP